MFKIQVGEYQEQYATQVLEIDSFQHTFVDGVSGAGKSTFVEDVIIQNIRAGRPSIVFDPHGPTVRRLLKHIPKWFSEKIIYWNPLAKKVPGLNFFHAQTKDEQQKLVATFLSVLKSWAGPNYGPETEHVAETASTAVIEEVKDPTVLHVYLFVMRELYRQSILAHSDNQLLKDFERQFDKELRVSERMSKFSPALNKIVPFVRPIARTIFAQTDSLDIIRLLDEGYTILIDLDKGKIGDVNAELIGSGILAYIQAKMFERKAEGRKEVTIFVDEFQNFGHGVRWTTFFAEGRKYDIRLWLITQSVTQVPEQWLDPILTGCNNIISFAAGSQDAERMAKEFGNRDLERALIFLPDRTFYAKIKDNLDRNFYENVKVFPPLQRQGDESHWRDVLKNSRMRWGKNRKDVEKGILRVLNQR